MAATFPVARVGLVFIALAPFFNHSKSRILKWTNKKSPNSGKPKPVCPYHTRAPLPDGATVQYQDVVSAIRKTGRKVRQAAGSDRPFVTGNAVSYTSNVLASASERRSTTVQSEGSNV